MKYKTELTVTAIKDSMMRAPRVQFAISFLLGIMSVISGYWLLAYFGFALACYTLNDPSTIVGPTWRMFIFLWTKPRDIAYLSTWIAFAAGVGGLGYWLARRGRGETPHRLAASAARFSAFGLWGAGIDLAILISMLGYRVVRWFG